MSLWQEIVNEIKDNWRQSSLRDPWWWVGAAVTIAIFMVVVP